jgi:hypothetical protein
LVCQAFFEEISVRAARQTVRPDFKSFRVRIIGRVWVTFAVLLMKFFQGLGTGEPDNERCRPKAFSTGLPVFLYQPEGSSSEIFFGASVRARDGERRRASSHLCLYRGGLLS